MMKYADPKSPVHHMVNIGSNPWESRYRISPIVGWRMALLRQKIDEVYQSIPEESVLSIQSARTESYEDPAGHMVAPLAEFRHTPD